MQTSPPVALTVGQSTQLNTPGSSPWASVVISNLSPFLLQILGGTVGGAAWLEPFTAMLYPVSSSHAPIVVEPQALAGVTATGSSQVQATWYAPGEEPQGSWPVSLTAQAISAALLGITSIASAVITAFSSQAVAATTAGTTISWTATAPVQGFRIRVQNNTDTAGVFVDVKNTTEGTEPLEWDQSLPEQNTTAFPVNIPAALGDVVSFTFQSLGAGTQNLVVTIVALGTTPGTQPTQPGLPIGVVPFGGQFNAAATINNVSSGAILPAPPIGIAYRLHAWGKNPGAGSTQNGGASLFITGGNTLDVFLGAAVNTIGGFGRQLNGQLAGGGVSILNDTNENSTFFVTYDLISVPNSSGIL